jgi:flagellar hook-associated protein 2
MAISFGGLGNGIDFGPLVELLVQAERQPIDRLNQSKLDYQRRLTDFGLLGSRLASLQSAVGSLGTRLSFDKSQVSVTSGSPHPPLTATVSSSAVRGTYLVTVNQIAAAHQIASKSATAVSSSDTDIVGGGSGTFAFRVGDGDLQTVTLESGGTLERLRDAINDLGGGASASLLNTGTGSAPEYRLVLSANDSGTDNAITIVTDDTTLDMTGTGIDVFQAAQNSEIELGTTDVGAGTQALTITRSGNTLTDVIAGVTINLQGVDPHNPVTIAVAHDPEAVKASITNLVKAYNDVVMFIKERTNYDPETRERGIFVGETVPRTILSQLRQTVFSDIEGLSHFSRISQIGFETQPADGTIKINDAMLNQALAENYAGVRDLFITNPTTQTEGLGKLLSDTIDRLNDVENGALAIRQKGLTRQIEGFTSQISRKEIQLVQFEEMQRIKFANLDGLLASMQSQLDMLKSRLR